MTTDELLKKLSQSLYRLVSILRMDPKCQWTQKFENDLDQSQHLIKNGYTESDLTELSRSIIYVFQGMGSFNDYAPGIYNPATGRYDAIPGTEDFDAVIKEMSDTAIKLRK